MIFHVDAHVSVLVYVDNHVIFHVDVYVSVLVYVLQAGDHLIAFSGIFHVDVYVSGLKQAGAP